MKDSIGMSIDHVVSALSADAANALATLTASANDDTLVSLAVDGVDVPLGTVSELLTTSQTAEILGVSDTYVRRLADAGTLPKCAAPTDASVSPTSRHIGNFDPLSVRRPIPATARRY